MSKSSETSFCGAKRTTSINVPWDEAEPVGLRNACVVKASVDRGYKIFLAKRGLADEPFGYFVRKQPNKRREEEEESENL